MNLLRNQDMRFASPSGSERVRVVLALMIRASCTPNTLTPHTHLKMRVTLQPKPSTLNPNKC
jgi:hypothetical protein